MMKRLSGNERSELKLQSVVCCDVNSVCQRIILCIFRIISLPVILAMRLPLAVLIRTECPRSRCIGKNTLSLPWRSMTGSIAWGSPRLRRMCADTHSVPIWQEAEWIPKRFSILWDILTSQSRWILIHMLSMMTRRKSLPELLPSDNRCSKLVWFYYKFTTDQGLDMPRKGTISQNNKKGRVLEKPNDQRLFGDYRGKS